MNNAGKVAGAFAAVAGLAAAPLMLMSVLYSGPPQASLDAELTQCTVSAVIKPAGALLGAKDIGALAYNTGWRGEDVDIAVAVARAESGWNPRATNKNSNGSVDYGLFQINSIHAAILAGGNWADPEDNAKMAFKVWEDAGGKWGPWVTYWSGTYKKFLKEDVVSPTCRQPIAPIEAKGACGPVKKGYPNGQIPRSALCSLWANRNHYLRGDAAAKFDALSKAFAAEFGVAPCMTDSYRSYAAQVDVRRRKGPGMTADPGTSNHGWGMALDLCAPGTQDNPKPWPGSERYEVWMYQNFDKYGWTHPKWARTGGSRPERWHYECNSCGAK